MSLNNQPPYFFCTCSQGKENLISTPSFPSLQKDMFSFREESRVSSAVMIVLFSAN